MKKLKYNIILTLPEEVQREAQKICREKDGKDVVFYEKITIEIYYKEDIIADGLEWEVYYINVVEINDTFDIAILKMAMDYSREMEENGGGHIEEFIYEMVMQSFKKESDEKEIRSFLEEISD